MAGFTSLAKYRQASSRDRWIPLLLRSRTVRALGLRLGPRLRRELMLRVWAWGYRHLNETGEMPSWLFAPDAVLNQTAEVMGTAGTFRGRERVQDVIRELTEAFRDVRFDPEGVLQLRPDLVVFAVRFSATGRGSGVATDHVIGHVFHLERGSCARLDVYWEVADALEALGAAEAAYQR